MHDMRLKLPRYFYLLIEKPLGHYFQVQSTYYQAKQCNQKPSIPKVTGQVWESQKWQVLTLITATTTIHLPKPISTDLTIKPDSALTTPIGEDEMQGWLV